jgi:hypothetical protein
MYIKRLSAVDVAAAGNEPAEDRSPDADPNDTGPKPPGDGPPDLCYQSPIEDPEDGAAQSDAIGPKAPPEASMPPVARPLPEPMRKGVRYSPEHYLKHYGAVVDFTDIDKSLEP